MIFLGTDLPGVVLIEPLMFEDARGFFQETWNAGVFAEAGLDLAFTQDNHSRSAAYVLRGLHYQVDHPQGKLVRVVSGAAFDVAVDVRAGSPTRGAWTGHVLSAANRRMLWIPPGFAHGFLSLAGDTDLLYKCTTAYSPATERSIAWDDPEIGIRWPLDGMTPSLSAKDSTALPLHRHTGVRVTTAGHGEAAASRTAVVAEDRLPLHV